MRKLTTNEMKILKIVHILFIIIWIGGGFTLGIISWGIPGLRRNAIYGAYFAMKIINDFLMIPGVIGILITGLIYGFWTNWGFIKYKWLIVKWLATMYLILSGTFFLGPLLDKNLAIANSFHSFALNKTIFINNQSVMRIFGAVKLLLFVFLTCISVIKPWGKITRECKYGCKLT